MMTSCSSEAQIQKEICQKACKVIQNNDEYQEDKSKVI